MDDNKRFWERVARLYAPIQERSNRALYDAVIGCCLPYLTEDARVLEAACGTGQLTEALWGRAGSWVATDFSEKMVAEARRRSRSGALYRVEDATALSYGDGCFDLVLIANALHIVPEPEKMLGEAWRVLRPGGVLLAPTFVYEGKVNLLRMGLTELAGFKTFHKWDRAQLVEVVEREGFRVTECRLLPGDPLPEAFAAFVRRERV